MLSDRRLMRLRRALHPLMWLAVVAVAMCWLHWRTPGRGWTASHAACHQSGWSGPVMVFRAGDRFMVQGSVPDGTPVERVGMISVSVNVEGFGVDHQFEKSVRMTQPVLARMRNPAYEGPLPDQAEIEALVLAMPMPAHIEPAAAASRKPGQRVVYFHDGAAEWKEYATVLLGMMGRDAAIAVAVALCVVASYRLSRRLRFPKGACRECGYDLSQTVHDRCPECGQSIPAVS